MKGLDTNLLVRYLVKDDPDQARAAIAFMRANCTPDSPCRINRIVLCELIWVRDSAYRYPRDLVADVLGKILRTGEFVIEDPDEAWRALRVYRASGADYADCFLAETNLAQGCDGTATFDRETGRLDGFELLADG